MGRRGRGVRTNKLRSNKKIPGNWPTPITRVSGRGGENRTPNIRFWRPPLCLVALHPYIPVLSLNRLWYIRRDLNPYAFRQQSLSLPRLPFRHGCILYLSVQVPHMAQMRGFEPPNRFRGPLLSREVPSATRPHLQMYPAALQAAHALHDTKTIVRRDMVRPERIELSRLSATEFKTVASACFATGAYGGHRGT